MRFLTEARPPAGALGVGDCEAVGAGLLAQPVAAVSSLAYVVAGVWLLTRLRGMPVPARATAGGYAVLLGLVGIGSVAYHGPQTSAAAVLHDAPISGLVVLVVGVVLLRLLRGQALWSAEQAARALPVVAALAAAAVVAYLVGRSGGPLCDPLSPWQGHALWHLLSAAALAGWGRLLWPRQAPAPSVGSDECRSRKPRRSSRL